jgi:transcriptional regulator with XRE-family HTH domain
MLAQTHSTEPVYQTITGGRITLSGLTDAEYRFLDILSEKFNVKQDWTRFAAWWNGKFKASGLSTDSVVYRICNDLEARLGIDQGKVSPPDYRDYLAELIDAKFGSRQEFCRATGVDPGQLSRVLASRDNLSMKVLLQVLEVLHARLVIQTQENSEEQTSVERAAEVITAYLRHRTQTDAPKAAPKVEPANSDWLDACNGKRQKCQAAQDFIEQAGTTWGKKRVA